METVQYKFVIYYFIIIIIIGYIVSWKVYMYILRQEDMTDGVGQTQLHVHASVEI